MSESRHLHWGAEALWQALGEVLPGLSVEVVASADSTNTQLLERARLSSGRREAPPSMPGELDALPGQGQAALPGRRQGDTHPCLLVAEQQTSGRGRQGRVWQSAAGRSLTFSLALPLDPPSWSGLSLAVGVALADALDSRGATDGPPRIGLKWPNDLFVLDAPGRGRKLGGVLIETVPVGERRMAVVGVGLNVLPQATAPAELSSGFACLQELDPGIDAPQALHRVALPLAQALRRFGQAGLDPFVAGFRRRDMLVGQRVRTTQPDLPEGIAEGIDAQGGLRVRAGALHTLVSGEVSVRPLA